MNENVNNNQKGLITDDVIRIVNEHHMEAKAKKELENLKEEKRVASRKNVKKCVISAALAVALTTAVIAASSKIYQQFVGKSHLVNKYYKEIEDEKLGVREDSQAGYIFNKGNQYISNSEAINLMQSQARELGYDNAETYVAVSDVYGSDIAKAVVGDENVPNFSEKYEAKQDAYYERQLGR